MMKKFFIFMVIFIFCRCASAEQVLVAAAANLHYVMDIIEENFERSNPDIDIVVSTASSGKLTAQIQQGAPFDIFFSANVDFAEKVFEYSGAEPSRIYALGLLALCVRKGVQRIDSLDILASDSISFIGIADPEVAPYGAAAVEALKNSGLYDEVRDKFAFAQKVSIVNTYIINGTVDAGFTSLSAVYDPAFKDSDYYVVPSELYSPVKQACVLLKRDGRVSDAARAFYEYIFMPECKKIFTENGYADYAE